MTQTHPSQSQSEFALFTQEVKAEFRTAIKEAFTDQKTALNPGQPLAKFPLHMRIDQVAAHLNCSCNHVRNLVEEGQLEAINIAPNKPREHLRITRDSVAKFQTQTL